MAIDYAQAAHAVLEAAGGAANVVSVAHCATRLRLVLDDEGLLDRDALDAAPGVNGHFEASGQLQVIYGTGVVDRVFEQLRTLCPGAAVSTEGARRVARDRANPIVRAIALLGDVFVPIIPAIVASGLLLGIVSSLDFLSSAGYLALDTGNAWYQILGLVSNTAFTFLQVLIGFSAARAFGANPYLGAVVGMVLINPALQDAGTVASEGVAQGYPVIDGLYSIAWVGYQGHVIPIVIACAILAVIGRALRRVIPEAFELFVVPLVSVTATAYVIMLVVGPVFVWAENAILGAIRALLTLPLGIGSLLMGALYAPTVVTGLHQMYSAIDLGQIAAYGVTYWLPLASAANVGQAGAALAVALRTRDARLRSVALPASLSAFMGITEPAIFGVNLRLVRPFVAGCIGGGLGAMLASVTQLVAVGTGVTGVFGIMLCLDMPLRYVAVFAVSALSAFAISYATYREGAGANGEGDLGPVATDAPEASTPATVASVAPADRWRMGFHLMPPTGWLNDPNGLCQFRGVYHVFHQYDPDWPEPVAHRGWGHFVSRDLVHWSHLGMQIAPDSAADASGAYSGSAVIVPRAAIDGGDQLRLYYTGNVKLPGEYDYVNRGRLAAQILVESDDGVGFGNKRVLLRNADYPAPYSRHVRDPEVWSQDGTWWMLLGARSIENAGLAILLRSGDGLSWRRAGSLHSISPFGYMWECPDRIVLDGCEYLAICAQGVERADGTQSQAGYIALALGERICDAPVVRERFFRSWDSGFDFYAPQSFVDDSGRALLMGWMGLPDSPYSSAPEGLTWCHCLTVPRELARREDGVILQRPVPELECLREGEVPLSASGAAALPYHRADLLVRQIIGQFELVLDGVLAISCDRRTVRLAFLDDTVGQGRRSCEADCSQLVTRLRVLVDSSAVEVFVNDGELTLSTRWFPHAEGLHLALRGSCRSRVWEMGDGMRATYQRA